MPHRTVELLLTGGNAQHSSDAEKRVDRGVAGRGTEPIQGLVRGVKVIDRMGVLGHRRDLRFGSQRYTSIADGDAACSVLFLSNE